MTNDSFSKAQKDTKKIISKIDSIEEKIFKILNRCIKNIIKSFKQKYGILNFISRVLLIIILILLINIPFNILESFIAYLTNNNLISIYKIIIIFIKIITCFLITVLLFNKYLKLNKKIIEKVKQLIFSILLLLPLYILNILLIILIFYTFYLFFKGNNTLGIIIILIGINIMVGLLIDIFNSFIYKGKKTNLFPFLLALLLIIIGSLI